MRFRIVHATVVYFYFFVVVVVVRVGAESEGREMRSNDTNHKPRSAVGKAECQSNPVHS